MSDSKDPPDTKGKKKPTKSPANSSRLVGFNTESDPVTLIRRAALKDRDFSAALDIVDLDISRQHLIPFIVEALKKAREDERARTLEELRAALDFMEGLPK